MSDDKRDYTAANAEQAREFYKEHHAKQTFAWASAQKVISPARHSVAELFQLADKVVDPSDPDISLS